MAAQRRCSPAETAEVVDDGSDEQQHNGNVIDHAVDDAGDYTDYFARQRLVPIRIQVRQMVVKRKFNVS